MKTFLRILIIGAILLILVFLSIGIVRVVPKALSSLASATVSLGSVFGGNNATSTTATTTTSTATTTGGFVIVGTSTPATATSTTKNPGYNNYVPRPTGTKTVTTYVAPTCASNGASNVAVTILSHGIINSSGQYIETNTFTTGDMVSVKFKVENRGTCPTGTWNLHIQMPAQNSADQARDLNNNGSLPAGSAVTGQANFSSPRSGNSTVIISVTDLSGRDSNTSDNSASSALVVTGVSNGTNYPIYGNGQPDLTVKILSVGVLDYNNNFTPVSNQNFRVGQRVAVKFQVINQGGNTTGSWSFRADVNDIYQPRSYQDPQNENPLPPGGSSNYTVSFDNLSVGQHTMTLTADSYNQVYEYNESNNSLGVNFYISY